MSFIVIPGCTYMRTKFVTAVQRYGQEGRERGHRADLLKTQRELEAQSLYKETRNDRNTPNNIMGWVHCLGEEGWTPNLLP